MLRALYCVKVLVVKLVFIHHWQFNESHKKREKSGCGMVFMLGATVIFFSWETFAYIWPALISPVWDDRPHSEAHYWLLLLNWGEVQLWFVFFFLSFLLLVSVTSQKYSSFSRLYFHAWNHGPWSVLHNHVACEI